MESSEYAAMRALEDTHWWYRSLRALVLEKMTAGQMVLDVGCGTGGMLTRLNGRTAVGIDLSGEAIAHARGRGLGRLCRASACALPFRSGSFDAVLALDVIYHREVANDAAAVSECARVLRPGGTLLLHVPAYGWLSGPHDRTTHGARRYTVGRIREIVLSAGLEIRELGYRNLLALPFAVALRRLGLSRFFRKRIRSESDLHILPRWLNSTLYAASCAENRLLRFAPPPAGLSVWCVAEKRKSEDM